MKVNEFHEKLHTSPGIMMIVAGLARLVEDEGYSAREATEIGSLANRETFFGLLELQKEREDKQ